MVFDGGGRRRKFAPDKSPIQLTMKQTKRIFLASAASLLMGASCAWAGIGLTKASPTMGEDFNSMWDSDNGAATLVLPANWRVDRNLTAPRRVSAWSECSPTVMYEGGVSLASNAKNGTWNFGAGDSDRAVGGLTTTVANGTRGVSVVTELSNEDPAGIITGLTLSYNIEKYRKGANAAGFAVQLYTSFDGTKWTAAGEDFLTLFPADDATEGSATVPISVTKVENKALRTHVEPGKNLYVAWNISVASGTTPNAAPGLALDDVSIKATFADSDPDWTDPTEPEINHSGIYVRGEVNGWAADDEWEFNKLSDTTFELKNKTLSGAFKIGGMSWTDGVNYGSNGGNILMDEPYATVSGETSGNISCGSNSYPCKRIFLTIEGGEATLLLEADDDATGLKSVYMVGDFNAWNYMDTTGELKLDAADGLFKGRLSMTPGADGLCRWRIYQRTAMAGAWGLESDASEASAEGTLLKGKKGNAASQGGTYDVEFNLTTGAYRLTKVSSVATEMVLSPAKAVLTPAMPAAVRVLSLNNSLIHYNDQALMFNNIAKAMGADAEWTKHTLLGKSLATHWDEGDGLAADGMPGAKMLVRSEPWTHIILQEQSALPRTNLATFRANVERWVNYIRESCPNPNAVIILPVNWAYSGDWNNFTAYNEIFLANYRAVAEEFGLVVCPVMSAYQTMYDEKGAEGLAPWFQDDRHPTDLSTYMAACMEYGLIMGVDPTTISQHPASVGEADAADMRSRAARALGSYVQTVDNAAGTIRFAASVLDEFGMPMDAEITYTVSPETGVITPEGVFTATEEGEYTVTAKAGDFTRKATVTVTKHIETVTELPSISLDATASEYAQDFDGMGSEAEASMPEGWRIARLYTPREVGTFRGATDKTMYAGGTSLPSNAKNGLWNFGASDDDTDRAPGGITTGVDGGTRAVSIYARFVNTGRKALEAINVSYDVEKYRNGNNGAGFTVKLYTSADGSNWTEAGADFTTEFPASSATAGAATVPMETKGVSGTLDGTLAPGCELYLAWNISVTSGTNCAGAPALAIDNFTLEATPEAVPEYKWHIYIEDLTGYDAMGVYAYGDKEIWGAWPGQAPIDEQTIDGTTYKVFGHNEDSGSYSLIVNNWNRSLQLPDYAIVGGRDYRFTATPTALTEKTTSGVEDVTVAEEAPVEYFTLQGIRVSEPVSGIYIRKQGPRVSKIMLR